MTVAFGLVLTFFQAGYLAEFQRMDHMLVFDKYNGTTLDGLRIV